LPTVRYLSLFSGIGGFELGLEAAGKRLGIDFDCVGYSEIDKWALRTYERHFTHRAFGDVTAIEPATLPGFDLLVAGFPCQPFSTAGGRLGFDDERGTLFFDVAGILQHKRPRNFILENVPGLLQHESGETFNSIIRILTGLGYCCEWEIRCSSAHGIAQARERIFIIGHLGGVPDRLVFPLGNNIGRKVDGDPARSRYGDRVFRGPVDDTPAGELTGFVRSKAPGIKAWATRSIATTIDANYGSGPGYGGNRTHVGRVDNGVLRLRKLTPVEAERCEGLPDNWTAGHSATQRYRQIGNAVVPAVVEAITMELYQHAQINLPGESLP
jgi:DNA (cytosine-5)-methyltransferase 1